MNCKTLNIDSQRSSCINFSIFKSMILNEQQFCIVYDVKEKYEDNYLIGIHYIKDYNPYIMTLSLDKQEYKEYQVYMRQIKLKKLFSDGV